MIPLTLSLVVLSCLCFAGAEPVHVSLTRKRTPMTMDDYGVAADSLRSKYGFSPGSTPSKRQNTAAIPIINQVCPGTALVISPNNRSQNRDARYLGAVQIGTP